MVAQSSGAGKRRPGAAPGAVGRTVAAMVGVCVLGIPLTASARHHHGAGQSEPGSEDSKDSKAGQEDPKPRHGDKSRRDDPKSSTAAAPEDKLPSGPLLLTVSIGGQRVTVYDNGRPVASSQISTGMAGHATPTGIFSIIQKQKWHHSNLYSNAPMPYMQRITWSGVALHAGVVPGYPASHGCIRLPSGFALRLYGLTRVGARVIVARGNPAPYLIEHPRLTALAAKPENKPEDGKPPEADQPPSAGRPDGAVVVAATGAVSDDASHHDEPQNAPQNGEPQSDPAAPESSSPAADGPPPPPPEKPGVDPLSRPGQLSLFVSRREGKLFVRKGFLPAFEVPVTIADPDKPLGNHIFTANGSRPSEGGGIRWLAVSMGVDRAPPTRDRKHKGQANEAPEPQPMSGAALRQSALDALDRIELPPEALARLSPLVVPGTSLTISDHGLGPETGTETDFIVVTH